MAFRYGFHVSEQMYFSPALRSAPNHSKNSRRLRSSRSSAMYKRRLKPSFTNEGERVPQDSRKLVAGRARLRRAEVEVI